MDAPRARRAPQSPEYASMQKLLADMQGHSQAWPFLEPVNPEVVPDYYEIIKNPMGACPASI
jgi:histone acetyltransferase